MLLQTNAKGCFFQQTAQACPSSGLHVEDMISCILLAFKLDQDLVACAPSCLSTSRLQWKCASTTPQHVIYEHIGFIINKETFPALSQQVMEAWSCPASSRPVRNLMVLAYARAAVASPEK